MDGFDNDVNGGDLLGITIKAGIGLGIFVVGYVGGALFGKSAAIKKAEDRGKERLYKAVRGTKKAEEAFSQEEIDHLEEVVINGRSENSQKANKG
jgi:hypothetical protein